MHRTKRSIPRWSVALAAAAALAGAGVGVSGTARAEAPISVPAGPPPPPLTQGPVPDLDLVFTAQVTGWIEPCG